VADIVFLEAGTAASRGLEFFTGSVVTGSDGISSVSSGTGSVRNNDRALQINFVSAPGVPGSYVYKDITGVDAAGRQTLYFHFNNTPATGQVLPVLRWLAADLATEVMSVCVDENNKLVLVTGGTVRKTGTTTVTNNVWKRVSLAWSITSSTNFTINAWVGNDPSPTPNLEWTATNADFTLSGTTPTRLIIGHGITTITSNTTRTYSDVYVDNGNTLDDPGDINLTPKLPAADSSINWNTSIGADPGSGNRYQSVDDRAWSTATGRQQAASTQASEEFTLQASSAGDVDISAKTVVGYGAYVYARRQTGEFINFIGKSQTKSAATTEVMSGGEITNGVVSTGDTIFVAHAADTGGSAYSCACAGATVTWTLEEEVNNSGNVRTILFRGDVTSGGTITSITVSWTTNVTARGMVAGRFRFTGTRSDVGGGTTATSSQATGILNKAVPAFGIGVFGGGFEDNVVPSGQNVFGGSFVDGIATSGSGAASNIGVGLGYVANPAASASGILSGGVTSASADNAGAGGVYNPLAGAGTEKIRQNGSDANLSLTGTTALHQAFVTTATYPTGAFGVKSTGNEGDTFLYELGMQVAYTAAASGTATKDATDSLKVQGSEQSFPYVLAAATESARVQASEQAFPSALADVADSLRAQASEVSHLSAIIESTDAAKVQASEQAVPVVRADVAESGRVAATESPFGEGTASQSDSAAVQAAEAQDVYVRADVEDAARVQASEAASLTGVLTSIDSARVQASEEAHLAASVDATESARVAGAEQGDVSALVPASDSVRAQATEQSFPHVSVSPSDSPAVQVSELSHLSAVVDSADSARVQATEQSVPVVSVDTTDAERVAATEDVHGYGTADLSESAAVRVGEESHLRVAADVADVLRVAGAEVASVVATLTASETLRVACSEASALLVYLAPDDAARVQAGEQVDLRVVAAATDEARVQVDEAVTVLAMSEAEDSVGARLSEAVAILASLSPSDASGVGATDRTDVLVHADATESAAVGVNDTTGALLAILAVSDALGVGLQDAFDLLVAVATDDQPRVFVSEVGWVEVIGGGGGGLVAITATDSVRVFVAEQDVLEVFAAVSEAARVQADEQTALQVALAVAEACAARASDEGHLLAVCDAADAARVQVSEQSTFVVQVAADDALRLGLTELYDLMVSAAASEAVVVVATEDVAGAASASATDDAQVQVGDQPAVLVSVEVLAELLGVSVDDAAHLTDMRAASDEAAVVVVEATSRGDVAVTGGGAQGHGRARYKIDKDTIASPTQYRIRRSGGWR
jgi:hypothetical protein